MGRNMVLRPEFGRGNGLEFDKIVTLVGRMRAVQRMLPVGIHVALYHGQNISQENTARSGPKFGEIEASVSPIMMPQLGSRGRRLRPRMRCASPGTVSNPH